MEGSLELPLEKSGHPLGVAHQKFEKLNLASMAILFFVLTNYVNTKNMDWGIAA